MLGGEKPLADAQKLSQSHPCGSQDATILQTSFLSRRRIMQTFSLSIWNADEEETSAHGNSALLIIQSPFSLSKPFQKQLMMVQLTYLSAFKHSYWISLNASQQHPSICPLVVKIWKMLIRCNKSPLNPAADYFVSFYESCSLTSNILPRNAVTSEAWITWQGLREQPKSTWGQDFRCYRSMLIDCAIFFYKSYITVNVFALQWFCKLQRQIPCSID